MSANEGSRRHDTQRHSLLSLFAADLKVAVAEAIDDKVTADGGMNQAKMKTAMQGMLTEYESSAVGYSVTIVISTIAAMSFVWMRQVITHTARKMV